VPIANGEPAIPYGPVEDEQSYCDWCFASLTPEDRERSKVIGLPREQAWGCSRCIGEGKVDHPPDGWDGPAFEWPFFRPKPAG
jgi:hypothetical protein